MKAAYIEQTGGPEVIQYGELPTPTPGEGEVLVRVGAVSVNPIDTYIRSGAVAMPLPKPFIVGCDLAGTVEAVGPGTHRFTPGQRVWGSNQGLLGRQGTFAEYACVAEQYLYESPAEILAQGHLLGRASGGDDPCANGFGHLHHHRADAARATVDEDGFALVQPGGTE